MVVKLTKLKSGEKKFQAVFFDDKTGKKLKTVRFGQLGASDYTQRLLMKTELRHLLDPNYRCVHEHIDLCLGAKQLGHEIYIEPTSVVAYLNTTKLQDCDMSFFKDRWGVADCDHDIDYFCNKWGYPNTTFDDIRRFIKIHTSKMRS